MQENHNLSFRQLPQKNSNPYIRQTEDIDISSVSLSREQKAIEAYQKIMQNEAFSHHVRPPKGKRKVYKKNTSKETNSPKGFPFLPLFQFLICSLLFLVYLLSQINQLQCATFLEKLLH